MYCKKGIVGLTTMGLLLGYGVNPRLSSAVARIGEKTGIIFCRCDTRKEI
jgi:hypothetical protein